MMVSKLFAVIVISILTIFSTYVLGNEKICRFMTPRLDGLIRLQARSLWNPLTGYFCYNYTGDYRLNFIYQTEIIEINGSAINVTWIDNNSYFLYDYTNETSLDYIRRSFKKDIFFEKWKTCCREAAHCCDVHMTSENIYPNIDYPCPAVWDSWTCFLPAKADTISRELCPTVTFSAETRACELFSKKTCFSGGYWNPTTDYETTCALAPILLPRHDFHVTILAVSAALCVPAVLIFFSFRNFRQKVMFILHRNLILVIVVRNLLTIMSKEIILKDELISADLDTVMSRNSVSCRILAFFENVAKNGIFSCMLADGFYLHKSIVRPFTADPKLVFIYSAVLIFSFLPSLVWALLRGLDHGTHCWMVDNSNHQWVSDGFRLGILGINTFLLLDIIRVIVMKLRDRGISEQAKTTFRVTLFLIPLFGIHIIVISNRDIVPSNTCSAQDIYYYISYMLEGFQGIIVAFLFCYTNSEVHHELMNAMRKIYISFQQRLDNNLNNKNLAKRRPTTATYVESVSD
ncbi:calcitonin gene-related peptide type 1 receptor-like isoform X1 [Zophobas morio]|uniref:calcitonin gene-related peptide type 1 receptor-like isoform X1 n=3 Tax=Zophobas morio TaxID=2755281 RepID=UPI003082E59E